MSPSSRLKRSSRAVRALLAPEGEIIALVKPQFEAGPGEGGEGRDRAQARGPPRGAPHIADVAEGLGYRVAGLIPSPITGTEGNIEFLIHLIPGQGPRPDIDQVVDQAHARANHPPDPGSGVPLRRDRACAWRTTIGNRGFPRSSHRHDRFPFRLEDGRARAPLPPGLRARRGL